MSATWSIAKGRFDMFLACSTVPASRSTAQLLIGTRPGLLTRGSLMVTLVRSTAETASTDVDVSVSISDDMAAGPPAGIDCGGLSAWGGTEAKRRPAPGFRDRSKVARPRDRPIPGAPSDRRSRSQDARPRRTDRSPTWQIGRRFLVALVGSSSRVL